MAAAKKYEVVIGNLVAHELGDVVTAKQIEEAGGNVDHLVTIGAIRATTTKTKEE